MAMESYSKLLRRALGAYCVRSKISCTITIVQDGILNTVSVDHILVTPRHMQLQGDKIIDKYIQ